jgi:hypothetical protein
MPINHPGRPEASEYAPDYQMYIALVPEDEPISALSTQLEDVLSVFRDVSEQQAEMRHPPYTWSLKEVLGHLIDTERVMAYRALRFARGDATALPGFEQDDYVRTGKFDDRSLADLVDEFALVRGSSVWLLRGFDEEAWQRSGVANGNQVSVRALAAILVGHARHHLAIVRRRLGVA